MVTIYPRCAAKLNLRVVWDHRSSCQGRTQSDKHLRVAPYVTCAYTLSELFGTYEPHEVLVEVLGDWRKCNVWLCVPCVQSRGIFTPGRTTRGGDAGRDISPKECDSDSEDMVSILSTSDDDSMITVSHNGYGYGYATMRRGMSIPLIDIPLPTLQHLLFQSTDFRVSRYP